MPYTINQLRGAGAFSGNELRPLPSSTSSGGIPTCEIGLKEISGIFTLALHKCESTQVSTKEKWILWHGLKDIGERLKEMVAKGCENGR